MDDGLRENDPNRAIKDSEKSGIRPGFLGGTGGGETPAGSKAEQRARDAKEAKSGLQAAEDAAADEGGLYRPGDGLKGAKENEEAANGFYSGDKEKWTDYSKLKPNNKKKKGFFKKAGPAFAIIFAIFGIGFISSGTQMMQPFSLVAQFTEKFGSMETSANLRSKTFFKYQMGAGKYKNPVRGRIFSEDTFKISKKQQERLLAQGIEYDDNFDGNGTRVLKYNDPAGNTKIITADIDTANRLGDGAIDFKSYYADDLSFFERYNNGSTTWRGAIANWFGTMTEKFFKGNSLTRNLFQDFRDKVAQNGGDSKATAQKLIGDRSDSVGGGGIESVEAEQNDQTAETDENGNKVYEDHWNDVDESEVNPKRTENNTVAEGEAYRQKGGDNAKARESYDKTSRQGLDKTKVSDMLGKIGDKVQKGADIACSIGNLIGSVTLLVTAAEALQIINLTTAYFESVDKVKAGDGDNSPIHDLTNAMNESKKSEYEIIDSSGTGTYTDSLEGSAMQSQGIAELYGGHRVEPNDPSVQSFNFTNSIKRILGGIGVSMAGFKTCTIANIVVGAVDAMKSGLEVAGCILGVLGAAFTFGVSTTACAGLLTDLAGDIIFDVAQNVIISTVIATILPTVASMLTRDLVSDLGGIDLGNALTSGGNMYLGNTHRMNGGSLANEEKYVQFAVQREQVIAEKAKQERATLSPFDLTSKYTFMGALMTQFMGFMTTNSLMSGITAGSSAVSSSVVALTPTATANSVSEHLPDKDEYEETCPYLASIDAVGDAYCNPYSMTDVTTMEDNPSDVIDKLEAEGNFSGTKLVKGSDGDIENVVIDGDSDLAKYILYCDSRESAFGIADANIIDEISSKYSSDTGNSTFDNVIDTAIGDVPVLGSIITVASNETALNNIGYISGESCVAGNDVDAPESPNWDTAKYYQRFIEDQSLAESSGVIEESAVSAFLDEYYEENPLDNSYEGILARRSGLTKDTVVAILDLAEYAEYVAEYDSSTRYAFGEPAVVEESEDPMFDNENVLAGGVVLPQRIIYADVRNRNFAV